MENSRRSVSIGESPKTGGGATSIPEATSAANMQSVEQSYVQHNDLAHNPFSLPSDEEIFLLQEEEKARKKELMRTYRSLPVHLKSTFASRISATVPPEVSIASSDSQQLKLKRDPARERTTVAMSVAGSTRRERQKENMTEFIAKKREIFLVQMSLDTKRAEITKLEERAAQREEALKKSEGMLEEDALRFDAFLKENDEKVQEAIKRAEVEAKAKQDKVNEIKRLNASIAVLRSELNKYEEQLEDCRRFQRFLDAITPHEWFAEQRQLRAQREAARQAAWRAECEAVRKQKQDAKAAKTRAEYEYANARTQQEAERAEQAMKDAAASLKEINKIKEPPPPPPEPEEEAGETMYFTDPRQLLKIYGQLEEQDLFLIQNAQEMEESLEELRGKARLTRERMNAECEGLRGQLAQLQAAIKAEAERCAVLKERANQNFEAAMGISVHDVTLEQLAAKIAAVYERCGFDRDASMSTLQMLTNIETKLEEYLAAVEALPAEFVEEVEKAREKERRQVAREGKMLAQKQEHEARVRRALERAAAPVFKKTGKPVMFRSQAASRKVVQRVAHKNDDETELEVFLARAD